MKYPALDPAPIVPWGPGAQRLWDDDWTGADAALQVHALDMRPDGGTVAEWTVSSIREGGTAVRQLSIELTRDDLAAVGAWAMRRLLDTGEDGTLPLPGWTCHLGHPTTPPVTVDGIEYRFCPECAIAHESAAHLGEYSDHDGIIVTTAHEHETDHSYCDPDEHIARTDAGEEDCPQIACMECGPLVPSEVLLPDAAIVARALHEAEERRQAAQQAASLARLPHGTRPE